MGKIMHAGVEYASGGIDTHIWIGDTKENYSTEEKVVGTWTDGKPLYQKLVNCGKAPNSSQKDITIPVQNYEIIWIENGFLYNPTNNTSLPFNMTRPDSSSNSNGGWLTAAGNIRIVTGYDRSDYDTYVVLRYTKTTDMGHSVPLDDSKNYSIVEKIVGTWINGKPIYQITINTGVLPDRTSKTLTTPPNIKHIIHYEGFIYKTSDITNQRSIPNAGGGTDDIRIDLWNGDLRILTYNNWTSYEGYVTIQYTKTTD